MQVYIVVGFFFVGIVYGEYFCQVYWFFVYVDYFGFQKGVRVVVLIGVGCVLIFYRGVFQVYYRCLLEVGFGIFILIIFYFVDEVYLSVCRQSQQKGEQDNQDWIEFYDLFFDVLVKNKEIC